MPAKIEISDQKKRLIADDLECYMMGQIKISEIARNRGVSYFVVIKIQNEILEKRLQLHKRRFPTNPATL